jgi:hypothetical protein
MAMMATHTELEEEQKTWVLEITHVLGAKAANPNTGSRTASRFTRVMEAGSQAFRPENIETVRTPLSALDKARSERSRALIVPREHGAWGLLLVPMITGAGIAFRQSTNIFPFVLLLTAALTLFWLRTPLESLLGISPIHAETPDERESVMFAVFYLGAVATLALGMLLWASDNPLLWPIGTAAGFFFVAQALVKNLSKKSGARSKSSTQFLRMLSEIIGTVGLTAAAPAAYYVITGKLDATAWVLWLANLLFAGNQIHYVQLRIHTARIEGLRNKLAYGWAFATGQALMTAAVTILCISGWLPKFASLAFAPVLFRGWFYFVQKPAPLKVRRLGWTELTQAITFCVLIIGVFTVSR